MNRNTAYGNRWVFVVNGRFALDNFSFKHVVFRNVHVVYAGTPVELEGVYFLDCSFEFVRTVETQNLALAILSADPSIDHFEVG